MRPSLSPHRHSVGHKLLHRLHQLFRASEVTPMPRVSESPQTSRVEAAHAALAQAMSPTERVHAVYQAQSAGVPLHEIERQLDWAEARSSAV